MTNSALEDRVIQAADAALAEQGYVSALDVLMSLGWLTGSHVDRWRQGRVGCLEFLSAGDANRTRRAHRASGLTAVVVRFSRTRRRYERQGLLVEPQALDV